MVLRFEDCPCTGTRHTQPWPPPLPSPPLLDSRPRWDASVRHAFMNVDPAEAALTVRLHDARGGFLRNNTRLLGEATIHCSHIKVGAERGMAGSRPVLATSSSLRTAVGWQRGLRRCRLMVHTSRCKQRGLSACPALLLCTGREPHICVGAAVQAAAAARQERGRRRGGRAQRAAGGPMVMWADVVVGPVHLRTRRSRHDVLQGHATFELHTSCRTRTSASHALPLCPLLPPPALHCRCTCGCSGGPMWCVARAPRLRSTWRACRWWSWADCR